MLLADVPGLLPRSEKQVSNFKTKLAHASICPTVSRDAAADNLFRVMQQAYCKDSRQKFVRSVNAAPEPAIVVSTDLQLQDLTRFCTLANVYSPLTVDPTFCLGAFDVTLITFHHLFLQTKRYRSPPVFAGPACIHYKKNFPTYLFFASTIIGQQPALRVIGTDGEKPLINAYKHEFGFSQKVHVCEYNIADEFSVEIVDDIFGKKLGAVYIEGLVDGYDTKDFDEKLKKVITRWRHVLQPSCADIEGFINWFRVSKAQVVQESMLWSIKEAVGLDHLQLSSQRMLVKLQTLC